MPEAFTSSEPSLTGVARAPCPKCRTRMSLARISPGPAGNDLRTFECSRCNCVHQEMVAIDPMLSHGIGWLTGELKAPK